MEGTRNYPTRSLNQISSNTLRILENIKPQLEKISSPSSPSPNTPDRILFKDALQSKKFSSKGMGLWKGGMNKADYGRIWVKKTFIDEKTGEKEEWLVKYTNDDDEIIRQVASEYGNTLRKRSSMEKRSEEVGDKVPLQLAGLDGNAFSIMGRFQSAARKQGWQQDKIQAVLDEAMSGDYDNLLVTMMKYTYDPSEEEDIDYDEYDDLNEINDDDYDELQMDDEEDDEVRDSDIVSDFNILMRAGDTSKEEAILILAENYGRDRVEIENILNREGLTSSKKLASYKLYYKGKEDPYVEGYDKHISNYEKGMQVEVYEFPSEEKMISFLEDVGGIPHPLGGNRVIVSSDKLSSKKLGTDFSVFKKYPQYRNYFLTLQGLQNPPYSYGHPKMAENGINHLIQKHPELDEVEAGKVLNIWLGEFRPYDSGDYNSYYSSKTAANVDPKNIPLAPGIKSKNITIDESGGAGTGKVTIEFTDVDKALKFYEEEVVPEGGSQAEVPKEEVKEPQEQPQPQVQPQQQSPLPPQVQPKASSLSKNSNEDTSFDQYGQILQVGDRVRDEMERRGTIERIVGNAVYVTWGGPFEGAENENRSPILMDSSQLTKWSNLKSTLSPFQDGIMGIKVIRYGRKQDIPLGNSWETLLKYAEGINPTTIQGYSFINENGVEIPLTLKQGIKVGEMFERPDNHSLVRFAGWIDKKALEDKGESEDDFNDIEDDDLTGIEKDYKEMEDEIKEKGVLELRVETDTDTLEDIMDSIIDQMGEFQGEELEGGLGDGKEDEEFDEEQLEKGKEVEKEHTDDEDIIEEITKDHLSEDGKYYDKLEKVEKESSVKKSINKSGIEKRSSEYTADDFYNGMKVKLKPEYEDNSGEVFTLSQWDGRKGWIGDSQGRGWYANWTQLIPVDDEEDYTDNDEYDEDTFSSLNKTSDHALSPSFGNWVAGLERQIPEDRLSQYHNILAQFLPEGRHDNYDDILSFSNLLNENDKVQLETYLYELIGKEEFSSMRKKSIQNYVVYKNDGSRYIEIHAGEGHVKILVGEIDPEEGGETVQVYSLDTEEVDGHSDDESIIRWVHRNMQKELREAIEVYRSLKKDSSKKLSFNKMSADIVDSNILQRGDRVKLIEEFSDDTGWIPAGETGTITMLEGPYKGVIKFDNQEYNDMEADAGIFPLHLFTKIASQKTAADISDQIPPMGNTTDVSQREEIESPQQQQPLPPRPELNNQPGDVLYDSNQNQKPSGKFQVTTDPADKTVTVKFLDEEKSEMLDQFINQGQSPTQPQRQPSLPVPGMEGFAPEKDFQDTQSGVNF